MKTYCMNLAIVLGGCSPGEEVNHDDHAETDNLSTLSNEEVHFGMVPYLDHCNFLVHG